MITAPLEDDACLCVCVRECVHVCVCAHGEGRGDRKDTQKKVFK